MPVTHLATAALIAQLAAISFADLRAMRIPDALNASLFASGIVFAYVLGRSLLDALIGAGAGYGALALLGALYRRARGRDGLGLGDAKLLGALGAWLGWQGLPFVLLIAASCGVGFVAYERLRGRTLAPTAALPFGPFIAIGAMIVWCAFAYA